MTINADVALKLIGNSSVSTDSYRTGTGTVLSGMKTTRFFHVYGQLILVNLTLKDGKTSGKGGAILVETFGSKLHLLQTIIRDCLALSFGGAVALKTRQTA